MRKRIHVIIIAVVLAILSFAYGRYRYVSHSSATLTNPFNSSERARLKSPFIDKDLFGSWVKDEMVFAIVLPVAFVAGGLIWAVKK
jgi:flagellar basal body-associated protein FliL